MAELRNNIRLGLAHGDDAAAIADLSRRCIEQGLPPTWGESRVTYCMRNPECVVLAARERRRFAGFAIMEYYDDYAHLNLLAVHPGYRRQGVGRAMLEWLESTARTAGIFSVRLELRASNDAALAFYERLGYMRAGRRSNYYAGREDALRMQRDLAVTAAPQADSPRPPQADAPRGFE